MYNTYIFLRDKMESEYVWFCNRGRNVKAYFEAFNLHDNSVAFEVHYD